MINKHILAITALLSTTILYADTKSDLANIYTNAVNSLLFFTSEDIISSGSYTFDNSNATLDTHFIPFTYQFPSDSEFYNFYANGSAGYSKFEDSAAGNDIEVTTYAVKAGGGIRLNVAKDTDIMFGASYLYSYTDSEFTTPLPIDPAIATILNGNQSHHTYELSSSIEYHPIVNDYKPYISADVRYFYTNIDTEFATEPDTTSLISKLKIGVITSPVTTIYGLPLKLEFYASEIFLAGDLDDTLGFDKFFVAGTTVHLDTSSLVSWIGEVTFDTNIVKGDNFDGFNFGFGLSF